MRFLFAALGLLMFVGGGLFACTSVTMKTTVVGEGGQDVHNIGLIGRQQAETTLWSAVAIAGAVLFGSAGVMDTLAAQGRRAEELADKESKGQASMLRLLDAIDANTRHVEPFRPASAKPDASFDAAVAAEMAPPRSAPQPVRAKLSRRRLACDNETRHDEAKKQKANYTPETVFKERTMRNACTTVIAILFLLPLLASGCGKRADEPPQKTGANETATKEEKKPPKEENKPPKEDSARDKGDAAFKKGDLDLAIANYTEAIRLDPKDAITLQRRGWGYWKKGDWEKAVADYSEIIRLDPKDAKAYCFRGLVYSGKGDLDKAIADYSDAIRLNPNDGELYCSRGAAYGEKGEDEKAIADSTEAIRLDPKNAKAFSNRGSSFAKMNDLDKAIADQSEAIRLDPKAAVTYFYRANTYLLKEDFDKAIADFSDAIRLDPKYAKAYSFRGLAYTKKATKAKGITRKQMDEKAIADLSEAIQLNPKDAQGYRLRAEAYNEQGDVIRAHIDTIQADALGASSKNAT